MHSGLLGDRSRALAPDWHLELREGGLHYEADIDLGSTAAGSSGIAHPSVTRHIYDVTLPFTARLGRLTETGQHFLLTFICSPHSAREGGRYMFISRNYGLDEPDERFCAQTPIIHEQDRRVVEAQRPEELPLDLSAELHLRGPDGAAVEYRRMLRELGLEGALTA